MMKKVNSRMCCFRKFKRFGVSADLLLMFYNIVISSTFSTGAACWGGNVSKHDQRRVDKVIHRASRIVGRQLDNFQSFYRGKVLHIFFKHSKTSHTSSTWNVIQGSVTEAAVFYSLKPLQVFYLPSAISILNAKLYTNM